MDVLSDILESVRLRSTVWAQTELVAPWGIRADPRPVFAFHVISRGHCWFEADGDVPVEVSAGDVLVLAPGRGHSLRDRPESPTRPLADLVASGAFDARHGDVDGDARRTVHLVCGCFEIDDVGADLVRSALPSVIHTRDTASGADPWIAQTLRLLTHEAGADHPGTTTVVNRLCEALFVYVVRSHLSARQRAEQSWLRGLADPQVSRALELLHQAPDGDWTVASLATRVGMSRSAFAARFHELVGQSPIKYLMRWRLQKAAALLRDGDVSIAEVAERAGYESQAAFSKAFKRSLGVAPGTYRRDADGR